MNIFSRYDEKFLKIDTDKLSSFVEEEAKSGKKLLI